MCVRVCACARESSFVCVNLRGSSFFRHSGVLPAAQHRLQRRAGEVELAHLLFLQGVSSPSNLQSLTTPPPPPLPLPTPSLAVPASPPPPPSHQRTHLGSKHATTAARYPPILPQSHRRRSSRLPPSKRARRLHRVMPLLQQEKHPATAHTLDACRRTRHHSLGP